MSVSYTHEGTPLILGGDELKIYHTGNVILNMFNPASSKWDANKYWGTKKLVDNKTEFTVEGFLMFDWKEIVAKDIVVTNEFTVSWIDLESLELASRYLNAVINFHNFTVDEDNIKTYEPIACQFDIRDTSELFYKGVRFSAPTRYNGQTGIRVWKPEDIKEGLIRTYDPKLPIQPWHKEAVANIQKAIDLYTLAVPNIPIRKRGKNKEA